MTPLDRRLTVLENKMLPSKTDAWVQVIVGEGETDEQAIARASLPEGTNIILVSIIDPVHAPDGSVIPRLS